MAEIIDGKLVTQVTRKKTAEMTARFKELTGVTPGLAVILVGDDPASAVYVRNKHKGCLDIGMNSFQIEYPKETTEEELLSKIKELNEDENVHGILVQLPLPKHINEDNVINAISPLKDVDAFHPENVGKILIGKYDFLPCTPAGVMELLAFYNIDIEGKECVVLGRSNIVGKPMSLLLLQKNGTVTVCHSRTKNLADITRRADILVVAIGKADFVTADMVKEGAVVIDVGINRKPDGKLTGDVDFNSVKEKASFITPVPGGVGPMTITMLLANTLTAAQKQVKIY
ncbi:MAG: bifunctional methylenetetrahydrofolate dehydrogenase/methenyltetrahydrofolate cyclohydrolase FolD [Clostridia bacterium]|nr:bifunctional methylenetetrahydrofolate dehydrogenase/methenyltetrahydrofolate cyclohydrolase FolD [Clostridia bacterium]